MASGDVKVSASLGVASAEIYRQGGPIPRDGKEPEPSKAPNWKQQGSPNWHGMQCCPQGVLEKPWRGWGGGGGGEMAWVTHGLAADLLRPCSHWLWP